VDRRQPDFVYPRIAKLKVSHTSWTNCSFLFI